MKSRKTDLKKYKDIKLIAMDVDGVLTGGEIIVFDSGAELKIWNVKDGLGFYLAKRSGANIKFAWITGRVSKQVDDRSKEMGIDILKQGCMSKKEAMEDIMAELGLSSKETLFIGDDIIDIPAFRTAGVGVCPSDAPDEVKKEVDIISKFRGGNGVVRNVIEDVLKSQGSWKKATQDYI